MDKKISAVTGSARGIRRACALKLAASGSGIVLIDLRNALGLFRRKNTS